MGTRTFPRRHFLESTATAAAGALTFARLTSYGVIGANDRIRFAVIGCGGMGTGHLHSLVKRSLDDNVKVPRRLGRLPAQAYAGKKHLSGRWASRLSQAPRTR